MFAFSKTEKGTLIMLLRSTIFALITAVAVPVITTSSVTNAASNKTLGPEELLCYRCLMTDGIDNPVCLRPVARKAPIFNCTGISDDYKICLKMVWYSIRTLKGQTLKSWQMTRTCVDRAGQIFLFGLELPCDVCVTLNGTKTTYLREFYIFDEVVPPPNIPESEVLDQRSVCVCCKDLCNADEGFNLSRLERSLSHDELNEKSAAVDSFLASFLEFLIIIVAFLLRN